MCRQRLKQHKARVCLCAAKVAGRAERHIMLKLPTSG